MSDDVYREVILNHYRNPRNFGRIDDAEINRRDTNVLCGDEVELYLKLDSSGRVSNAKFQGRGCAVSQATASILTEMVKGVNVRDLEKISLEDLVKALGSPKLGRSRLECVLLAIRVLKEGVHRYLEGKKPQL